MQILLAKAGQRARTLGNCFFQLETLRTWQKVSSH